MCAAALVGLAACAGDGPDNAVKAPLALGEDEVRVAALDVPSPVAAGAAYTVTFRGIEKGDPAISFVNACFTWSGEGPYCYPVTEDKAERSVAVRLSTSVPRDYVLTGLLTYAHKDRRLTTAPLAAPLVVTR